MENMQSFIIGIVIVGVTLVIGIYVSATIAGTMVSGSSAQNAANALVTALSGGSAWITILVVVGFAVIVLGMLSEGLGKAATGAGPVY
jgi:hypothetical protein